MILTLDVIFTTSAVDNGAEFGGSEKGQSLISAYWFIYYYEHPWI
jgi:hypothetical protein